MSSPTENPPALFCPTCSYDLRYTTDPRCPECGSPFDRTDLATSRIPWVHRKQLGLFKAWRQTTRLAIRPSRRLALEVALPVDARAASRFRWLNVLLATLLLSIGHLLLYPSMKPDPFRVDINFIYNNPDLTLVRILAPAFALIDGPARLLTLPLIALATFAALSWWTPFLLWITTRSSPARPRAAALSLYLSAWLPLLVLIFFTNPAILLSLRDNLGEPSTVAIISVFILDLLSLFTCWIAHLLLYVRTTRAGIPRTLFFAIVHPLGAIFLFYSVSIATAFLLGLLALIIVSLTT